MFGDLSWVREGNVHWGYLWLPPGTDQVTYRSQKRKCLARISLTGTREWVTYPDSEKVMFGDLSSVGEGNVRWHILSQRRECSLRISLTATRNRPSYLSWVREGNIRCGYPWLPETDHITYPESFTSSDFSIGFRFHAWLQAYLFYREGKARGAPEIKNRNLRHSYFIIWIVVHLRIKKPS